ncbi:NmrA domain-containing protein [Mycena chlorophos]|uniref:NmrA domain-containing protein n=1 Tax=Mycena chlorophos TaxID=658473 RepID=A0A8H6TSA2_MYCCL|nr:NmrA domain-containing protein [Mycena chlorophos]
MRLPFTRIALLLATAGALTLRASALNARRGGVPPPPTESSLSTIGYNPNYYCAAAPGTKVFDGAYFSGISTSNPNTGSLNCYYGKANVAPTYDLLCQYALSSPALVNTTGTGTCPADAMTQAAAGCKYLCPEANKAASGLTQVSYSSTQLKCTYASGTFCYYDQSTGAFQASSSSLTGCVTTTPPASSGSACNPLRRRYKKEDNFTAMLAKKRRAAEAAKARATG